jgi:Bacterial Ig domain/Domain of unknown function (DUF362)/Concanavalin A-like lectin/glucanases superfamily
MNPARSRKQRERTRQGAEKLIRWTQTQNADPMNTLARLWHSLVCGCHKRDHKALWSGWVRFLLPLMTAMSVVWFLARVIPKPIRATYPCQQAAFPLLSTYVVWLLGVKTALLTRLHLTDRLKRFRPAMLAASALVVLGLVAWAAERSPKGPLPQPRGVTLGSPSGDAPNSPMGVAKGLFPGRVTWIRDTNATPWDGQTGFWWQDTTGINQAAVDRMMSRSLRALTGATSDTEAWNRIFKFYNANHGRGNVGYATNDLIAIKINLNNDYDFQWTGSSEWPFRDNGSNNMADASAQTVRGLLGQLVNKAGVPQTNITLYDAVRSIPKWLYQSCQADFPGVQWVGTDGHNCQPAVWATNSSSYSVSNGCGGHLIVPSCVSQATYLINLPLLKGHQYAGVSLAGKNHYGSIPYRDHTAYLRAWQTNAPLYSMLVDLMGSRQLGDKTILYVNDALFGNLNNAVVNSRANCAFSNLFSGQWCASLFMSLDPVAIDSVGVDFLFSEFGYQLGLAKDPDACTATNCDHYLHEAALADHPPSGTVYQPDGVRLSSLGVHEHWNNPTDKQYSRNLSPNGTGIELLALHQLPSATVSIVSPTNGAVLSSGANVALAATTTTNWCFSASKLDFYADAIWLGSSTNPPFALTWTNPPAGQHTLMAIGSDDDGYSVTSSIVNVHIPGLSVVITNPAPGATFSPGANIPVQASAASDYSPLSEVDFYANDAFLGPRTTAPFTLTWNNAGPGTWGLSATARDAGGLSATSSVVRVYVRPDIHVALAQPPPGSVWMQGCPVALSTVATSSATDIVSVDYYANANNSLIGSANASPYNLVWSNAPPGLCALTAVATDTAGFCATSVVVNVTIKPSQFAVAGTLHVDLRATDFTSGSTIWTNRAPLGNFSATFQPPALDPNVAGTGIPGVDYEGSTIFIGPPTVPDLEGASPRSVEVWTLVPSPYTTEPLLFYGSLPDSAGFCVGYGYDPGYGAFQSGYYTTDNTGWNATADVPAPGVWHHLVYVYDGATSFTVYVDGTLSLPSHFHSPLATSPNTAICVGSYYLGGYINSLRLHAGALSPANVLHNYLAGPSLWDNGPVSILTQPQDATILEHQDVLLSVVVDGSGPFAYQWYEGGLALTGATNSTYLLTNVPWADTGAQLYCVISRQGPSPMTATSRTATIMVQPQTPVFSDCFAAPQEQRFLMHFSTVVGSNYRVDYTDKLNPPTWVPLAPARIATKTTFELTDYLTNRQRFYRVTHLP